MDTNTFLARILPAQGLYVLVTVPAKGKPIWKHHVFDTIEKMATTAKSYDSKGHTVYHACASYSEESVYDPKKDKWRTRVASNTAFVRSQWLDIDVGPGKDYATRKEAVTALVEMCRNLKIPAPMLISSGRGLHCYWAFTKDIPAAVAKPNMDAFMAAMAMLDFKHDTVRTGDLASVLRPVGTHNRKADPLPVKLLKDAAPIDADTFWKSFGGGYVEHMVGGPVQVAGMQTEGWTGPEKIYAPSSAKLIVQKCEALKYVALKKGNVGESLWRSMMGVIKFTVEGEPLIHTWSKGDPRYDKGETQSKIDGWEKAPASCAYINREGGKCEGCVHWGKITGPIQLGESADIAPAVKKRKDSTTKPMPPRNLDHYANDEVVKSLPFWPSGYQWDGENLQKFVVYSDKKKPSEWVSISNTLYYPFLRFETEDKTRAVKCCALIDPDRNKWRTFDIETTKIAEPQSLAYALGAHEVIFMPSSKSHNRQYMQDVLHGLREQGIETTTFNSFGWHGDGFVVGDQQVTKKGPRTVFLGSKVPEELHKGFSQKGTGAEWVALIDKIYNRVGAEAFQFAICAGFAAPLVKLNHSDLWHGLPIAFTGGTGGGKSTTAKVACSMYGDPRKMSVQANEEGTTMKALIQRVGTMRNLPLLLDEITGRNTEELQSMLFALSNGKPKMRLRADGQEINAGQSWDTITFITGNISITRMLADSDAVKADATQVRCFEIALEDDFTKRVFKDLNAKDLIEHQLLANQYGVIGQEYLRRVVAQHEQITKVLQRERAKFSSRTQEESRERFYYDLIANVLVAGALAKKMGFIHFDMAAIRKWAMQHVKDMRVSRKAASDTPEDYLQSFLSHLHQHTLITRYFRDGRQNTDDERVVESIREPLARNAVDDRKFIVTLKALQDWCSTRRLDTGWLVTQLEKDGLITGPATRQRICKGTKISGTQARCLELNYDKLDGMKVQLPDGISVVKGATGT